MKMLTVEEATSGLDRWVELALAGEQIQIRRGDGVVELRAMQMISVAGHEQLTPRAALQCLQDEGRPDSQQAEQYLREVQEERMAERQRPA